jgi:hypothetical protein
MKPTLFTTLEGLKRRAKRLKKETGCTHGQALDLIAQQGGYQNYSDAKCAFDTAGRGER